MTHLTHDDLTEILWRFEKGMAKNRLCFEFSIGMERLNRILREHDLLPPLPLKKEIPKDVDEFGEKVNQGKSYKEYLQEQLNRELTR